MAVARSIETTRYARQATAGSPFDAELAVLLVREAKTLLDEQFHPDGYNIGVNVGTAAGETAMRLHVHVIPR